MRWLAACLVLLVLDACVSIELRWRDKRCASAKVETLEVPSSRDDAVLEPVFLVRCRRWVADGSGRR